MLKDVRSGVAIEGAQESQNRIVRDTAEWLMLALCGCVVMWYDAAVDDDRNLLRMARTPKQASTPDSRVSHALPVPESWPCYRSSDPSRRFAEVGSLCKGQ